ncbi:DNA-binding PadR family transcriptional regulator [Saccharomonospora amisosensis]|uniref:DNA-binding PadR family transcriptional regulator n=1 Tax=Saccharomonospora amisosensis TaxID=1128677 RepID=A0A7X5UQ14_9PSEU|nr:PadR family transcriptional regulator [Saccharomonospora amisosensis]NIJ12111.1 DNA-binding PadR family transcriptional regulator [Saccharomonospora amisosensis]
MELTPSELVVLGLIIERPRHGYDIEQVIERRGIRQWTEIGFSSIYYLLAKLDKRGLVHTTDTGVAPKSRHVFHATELGRGVATQNTLAYLQQLRPVAHPLLVGVSNLSLLPDRQYTRALRDRLAKIEERIASVRQTEAAQAPLPLPAREVFSYSLSLLEAEREWLARRAEVR